MTEVWMTIKAVIFDVGGVLIRTEDYSGRRAWEASLGLARGEAEAIVFNSETGVRAQLGEISSEELWEWVGHRLSLDPASLQAFHTAFWSGDKLNDTLIDLIRELRGRYQLAVISNATNTLNRTLSDKYGIAELFDLVVGSATEKVMKPDPVIFGRALERLGRQPSEAVFIDDFEENVAAARRLGMHAIHFHDGVDVAARLADLGVS